MQTLVHFIFFSFFFFVITNTETDLTSSCLPALLHSEMKTQQPLHVATPVRQSLALTKVAGTSVYLKLDSSQPTGSFKIRGIGHLCKTVSDPPSVGTKGFVFAGGFMRNQWLHLQFRVAKTLSSLFFVFSLQWAERGCKQFVCCSGGTTVHGGFHRGPFRCLSSLHI